MPEQQGLTDGAIQWLRKLLENEGYYVGVGSREEWTAVWIGDDDWDQFCEPDWGNIQSVNAEPRVRLRAEQIPFVKTLLATIDRLTESPGSDGRAVRLEGELVGRFDVGSGLRRIELGGLNCDLDVEICRRLECEVVPRSSSDFNEVIAARYPDGWNDFNYGPVAITIEPLSNPTPEGRADAAQ